MRLDALSYTRIEQEPPRAAAPASHRKEADRNGPEEQKCQEQRPQTTSSVAENHPSERGWHRSWFARALGLWPAAGGWNPKRGAFWHHDPRAVPACRLA